MSPSTLFSGATVPVLITADPTITFLSPEANPAGVIVITPLDNIVSVVAALNDKGIVICSPAVTACPTRKIP